MHRSWVSPAIPPPADTAAALYGSAAQPAQLRDPARHPGAPTPTHLPGTCILYYDVERLMIYLSQSLHQIHVFCTRTLDDNISQLKLASDISELV